eukprot:scaffold30605_cov78-Skeletonema_dohrnii-CCMP3373.AAC.1
MRATLDRSTPLISGQDFFLISSYIDYDSHRIVTWFDIASKDFFREMFQTLRRRTILIIKLTGKKIDAYHIVL